MTCVRVCVRAHVNICIPFERKYKPLYTILQTIITRLYSMLWNAPFTCMGLPEYGMCITPIDKENVAAFE